MKNKLLSKLTFLQYISGIKKLKKVLPIYKLLKETYKSQKNNLLISRKDCIPIPNMKDYYKDLKKFIMKEPNSCESVKYFLEANIKIIHENYDYNTISKDDIILVCLIKDDISKIKEFITYYSNIGIKHFAFIDNNSKDGTYEFLLKESNINLYKCTDDYSTLKREGWLNRLYSRIGFNKWILCVDSDELFTFIGQEKNNILLFLKKCSKSYKRVRSLMLDMYSKDNLFSYKEYKSFEKEFCYFDSYGYFEEKEFRTNMIYGGPRARTFSTNENIFKCALSKYPLFLYEKGDFQGSSHWLFPYKKNKDVIMAVLRHYKFTNYDMKKYEERVKKGNYSNNSFEYKKYAEIIENNDDISFYNNKSKKYKNSNDLETIKIGDKKIEKLF